MTLLEEYQAGASLGQLAMRLRITPSSVYARVSRQARKLGVRLRPRLRKYRPWVGVDIDPPILEQVRTGRISNGEQRPSSAAVDGL